MEIERQLREIQERNRQRAAALEAQRNHEQMGNQPSTVEPKIAAGSNAPETILQSQNTTSEARGNGANPKRNRFSHQAWREGVKPQKEKPKTTQDKLWEMYGNNEPQENLSDTDVADTLERQWGRENASSTDIQSHLSTLYNSQEDN